MYSVRISYLSTESQIMHVSMRTMSIISDLIFTMCFHKRLCHDAWFSGREDNSNKQSIKSDSSEAESSVLLQGPIYREFSYIRCSPL